MFDQILREDFTHLQRDVGMRRQHVDVILTKRKDDDRFAPVNQVSSNLEDLSEKKNNDKLQGLIRNPEKVV